MIMQMSAAWTELDNSTAAEPPNTESIKTAIRQARPYEELKAHVKVAESFMASLERGAEREHSVGSNRQKDALKASQAKGAGPKAQQSPGKQSPGKQKKTNSRAEAVLEPRQQVEAPQQPESTCQAEAEQPTDSQQPESPQVPELLQVPEAPQVASPEQSVTAVQSSAVQAQAIAQQLEAAVGAAPAQESQPQLPSATAPVQPVGEDDILPSSKQQRDQPQHAADHNAAPPSEIAVAAAATAPAEDSHTSTSTEQGTELAKGTMQSASASLPADSTPLTDNVTRSSKSAESESQPALSSTQEIVGEAASSQAGGDSNQEADEAAAGAATHAASAASTSFAPASAPAAAAAPAHGPGSMQDFLSFLLPAENPSAASAMSSRATPPPAPSGRPSPTEGTERGQGGSGQPLAQAPPQPSRRVKPYTTTARAPAAPYRPPSAAFYRPPATVYDPTQADSRQSGQGMHHVCLPCFS